MFFAPQALVQAPLKTDIENELMKVFFHRCNVKDRSRDHAALGLMRVSLIISTQH